MSVPGQRIILSTCAFSALNLHGHLLGFMSGTRRCQRFGLPKAHVSCRLSHAGRLGHGCSIGP